MGLIRNQEQMERRAKHCVHYNGFHGHTNCLAGVAYNTINQQHGQCPCYGERPEGCSKYQARGMGAVDKEFAEHDASFNQTNLARKAIVAASQGKRGVRGAIACPVCSTGNLQYSIAGYNGHIHARCSTEGCVAWME